MHNTQKDLNKPHLSLVQENISLWEGVMVLQENISLWEGAGPERPTQVTYTASSHYYLQ